MFNSFLFFTILYSSSVLGDRTVKKKKGSGTAMHGFNSYFSNYQNLLVLWPRASYVNILCYSLFSCKMENTKILWEGNMIIHVRNLKQCLEHSRCSVNYVFIRLNIHSGLQWKKHIYLFEWEITAQLIVNMFSGAFH